MTQSSTDPTLWHSHLQTQRYGTVTYRPNAMTQSSTDLTLWHSHLQT